MAPNEIFCAFQFKKKFVHKNTYKNASLILH